MDALKINGLAKSFGQTKVLEGLTLAVPEHAVFGFMGPNGAGKTTTMKMVLGLLKADAGSIEVFGEKVVYGQTKTNRLIGYLPDVPEFYGFMTTREYLKLCGEITGMSDGQIKKRAEMLLELVGLGTNKKRIGGFSRGMKQRLGIAQALLNEPKLLICDEPTSALDPVGRKEILDILMKVKDSTTVVFSTHILSDVERICDYVTILHQGKAVMQGALEDMKLMHAKNQLEIEFFGKKDFDTFCSIDKIQPLLRYAVLDGFSIKLTLNQLKDGEFLMLSALYDAHIIPKKFEMMEPSLEHMFMEAVQ